MERDLTRGSVAGHIRALAPPAIVGMALMVSFEVVDAFWVGRLEGARTALAALAVGTYALWLLYAVGTMVELGAMSVAARRIGEGDRAAAARTGTRGLLVALGFWVVTALVSIWAAPAVVAFTGVGDEAAGPALGYLRVLALGSLPMYAYGAVAAVFRARGDTRTPMLLMGAALLLNAVVDPLLILGWGPLPAFGLEGAAWASVLTRGFAILLGLRVLARRGWIAPLRGTALRDPGPFLTILRVGVPVGAGMALYTATFTWIARILARFPEEALAGYVLGQKIESLSWAVIYGISTVAGAWVGQNLGAGFRERAIRGAWAIAAAGALLGILASLVYVAFAGPLIELFAPGEPGVRAAGVLYLRIIAPSQLFLALEIVLQDALAGSGDTTPSTAVVIVLTAARIPFAWWVGEELGYGVAGIFWVLSISTVLKGLLIALWFRTGRWVERGKVIVGALRDRPA